MVMDSKTGELLVMATSNRYDPLHIRQKDIPSLNPKFAEYPYEPGAVMMPFTIARAINVDRHYVKKWINTDYDKFQIGENAWIKDNHRQVAQQPVDILVNSSSIGISQIVWDMPATVFHDAMTNYGFGMKSGIDLPRDLEGMVKSEALLEKKLHRANTAFGYGMMATPIQLLKAYSMFANNGWMVTPHIAKKDETQSKEVLSKPAARQMKNMLIEVVKRGTGKKAQITGLTIGGKTGTAHIAKNARYSNDYHSSFYGFVEDKSGHSYTIGVLVIEAKAPKAYFASRSAVPVFKNIVKKMLRLKLLQPALKVTHPVAKLNVKHKTISPLKNGQVSKTFGIHTNEVTGTKVFNESISIKAMDDLRVQNVLDGKVTYVGTSNMLGKVIVVAHKNKMHTVYSGLSSIESTVVLGTKVSKGFVLGSVENTLVFQVTQDKKYVNPLDLIEL